MIIRIPAQIITHVAEELDYGFGLGIKALSWWLWCPDYLCPAQTEAINTVLVTVLALLLVWICWLE